LGNSRLINDWIKKALRDEQSTKAKEVGTLDPDAEVFQILLNAG
jgi:hypothetical protein